MPSTDVPCDRCGRHPKIENGGSSPFSFCGSCGLFVCSECWVSGAGACVACAATSEPVAGGDAATEETAANGPARKSKRRNTARRGRRSQSRKGVTALVHGDDEDSRPASPAAAPSATAVVADAPEDESIGVQAMPAAAEPPASPAVLQPVGPGPAEKAIARAAPTASSTMPVVREAPPRWVRPLPAPFVVRLANTLTEGRPFVILLTVLLGIGVIAVAWSVGLIASEPVDTPAVVVVEPTPTPTAVPARTVAPTPAATAATPERRYVVRRGDTLRDIARMVYGDEGLWTVLLEANRAAIPDPENLPIGVSLLVPSR